MPFNGLIILSCLLQLTRALTRAHPGYPSYTIPCQTMSAEAFATLRPTNALARLAFSDLYETFALKRQNTQEDAPPAFQRMNVKPLQTFDGDVLRLRLETERRSPPSIPERGYVVGKGPLETLPFDLLLCTKFFAKWHGINLRNPHARFNFFPGNRALYIASCSRSQSTQLTVNGESARRPYALNQHSMNIRFDKLEYTFQWTDYAATGEFIRKRSEYVTGTLGGPLEVDVDMPTPLLNKRTIGKWTLGVALGAGVDAEVQSRGGEATNSRVDRGSKGMTMETAIAFQDALVGLQVMHNGGWIHRDLKPTNIGVVGTPVRAVILDVGTSTYLRHGTTIKPSPGAVGTIGYLAPELELEDYNHSIDIWAMGITLYYLTYKHHPWHLALNPWRDRKENEELRPQFRKMYQEAIDKAMKDYDVARQSPTTGYIHRGCFVHA
ncbi:kinase-like protein [Xylariaceae sp. AK1471]|nr:kinase-like protein [Xylariaceae sp. AK1471]